MNKSPWRQTTDLDSELAADLAAARDLGPKPQRIQRALVAAQARAGMGPIRPFARRRLTWVLVGAVLLTTSSVLAIAYREELSGLIQSLWQDKRLAPAKQPAPPPAFMPPLPPEEEAVQGAPAAPVHPQAKPVRPRPVQIARAEPAPEEPAWPPPEGPSHLEEQLALFGQAKQAANQGRLAEAIQIGEEFLTQHPASSLWPEVEMSRAQWLFQAGRYPEAIQALEPLSRSTTHSHRRPAIFRLLGDAALHQDDCERARAWYETALGLGLPGPDQAQVQRALARCH